MEKKIGVITETALDLPKGVAGKKGIMLVPIHILVNDVSRLHGKEIVNQEVVEHISQKDDVSTEPPTPREYCSVFNRINDDYDLIYSLHVSSDLSQCHANAVHGLKLLKKKQKEEERGIFDNKIKVIDTRAVSISQGQIVNRIAGIVKTNHDQAKLDKYIKWLTRKATMFFVVDDLFWLKRAGKLNVFSGFMGKMLDIKPIIKLDDGKLVPMDKSRGKGSAIDIMVNLIKKTTPQYKRGVEVWVGHSVSLLDAKYVRTKLAVNFQIKENKIPIVDMGPTMVAHTGPGVVCVSILPY